MKFHVGCLIIILHSSLIILAGRHHGLHANHRYTGPLPLPSASQHVSQVVGYRYPVPVAASNLDPQVVSKPPETVEIIVKEKAVSSTSTEQSTSSVPSSSSSSSSTSSSTSSTPKSSKVQQVPASALKQAGASSTSSSSVPASSVLGQASSVVTPATLEASAAEGTGRQLHAHHSPQVQTIDVACGKEKMTVRVTFDQDFNGVIYAKGHYNEPNCRFTSPSQGKRIFQFEMVVGQCGVAFIDSGLTSGGQAYVEGMLVIILEPGVQEAWDAARKIRCLWEGNIDQTVTFPLSINMLESQTLTFSGDTATASLELQTGRGPRAPAVQGLVRVGELLTAVVTVQGDPDFDLVVRNCVATDGTPANRIPLSDFRGCAVKPKLMGGWQKQRNSGSIAAYSYLSAFKFPDVMDLFLECTVSLCKGACDECPEYLELHVPNHDHAEDGATDEGSPQQTSQVDISTKAKITKRSARDHYNETLPAESLRLRRVVHVVGPDDLPELAVQGPALYGSGCPNDCYSLLGIIAAVAVTFALMLVTLTIFGVSRRHARNEKC